jgi:hypothetical protein
VLAGGSEPPAWPMVGSHIYTAEPTPVVLVFVAVQLSLRVYSRGDYLFSDVADVGSQQLRFDVASMADVLFLPYCLWAASARRSGRAFWWPASGCSGEPAPSSPVGVGVTEPPLADPSAVVGE